MDARTLHVLLVEDSPSDVRLLQEALKQNPIPFDLQLARDGVEAMQYLRDVEAGLAQRPDIIILDLNLPKKNGYEVLREVKSSSSLTQIPVLVMSSSSIDEDIQQAYTLNANCYLTKPESLDDYLGMVKSIEEFWFQTARLPQAVYPPAMTAISPTIKRAAC